MPCLEGRIRLKFGQGACKLIDEARMIKFFKNYYKPLKILRNLLRFAQFVRTFIRVDVHQASSPTHRQSDSRQYVATTGRYAFHAFSLFKTSPLIL
jgi:hypothetical protein